MPSIVYADQIGAVHATGPGAPVAMAELAFQDLSVFKLDRYFSPMPVACLRASKGCYYGACTFCDSYYGLTDDSQPAERVVAEMKYLGQEFGVRHFEFVDQCLAPDTLGDLSNAIIAAGLDVKWFCNARTEPGFTGELLARMHRAGATMIMWGLETGSKRLLKLMKKGVSPRLRLDILRRASDVGIWNFAYVFLGFPSETEDEAMQTIDLLRDNVSTIHAYGRSIFTLGKHSPLMEDPSRYGILDWVEDEQEFSTNLSHRVREGLTEKRLLELSERCTQLCRQAYADPLWMALRSRENLHLYLSERGKDYVESCRLGHKQERRESSLVF